MNSSRSITIVGAGVAGLGAAWLLSRKHDVVVYEREARFGGHACTVDAPTPDLVIYLQAPVDVLLERIERRGIRYEQQIERQYLEKLQEAYARFFHDYHAAPLLIVNAAQADFVSNEGDYTELLEQVRRLRRGRQYYNPLKSAV